MVAVRELLSELYVDAVSLLRAVAYPDYVVVALVSAMYNYVRAQAMSSLLNVPIPSPTSPRDFELLTPQTPASLSQVDLRLQRGDSLLRRAHIGLVREISERLRR